MADNLNPLEWRPRNDLRHCVAQADTVFGWYAIYEYDEGHTLHSNTYYESDELDLMDGYSLDELKGIAEADHQESAAYVLSHLLDGRRPLNRCVECGVRSVTVENLHCADCDEQATEGHS